MDEEVHGFAADNVPGTAWDRRDTTYGNNGNLNMYSQHKHKKHQKWVAERQMDPYVYDFVAPEVDSLTHNLTYGKDWSVDEYDGPFDKNGQMNLYPSATDEAPKKAKAPAPAPPTATKTLEGEDEAAT